ncbi:MAG: hypothetical protein WCI92_18800, partial [Bacteroidota bacterium]
MKKFELYSKANLINWFYILFILLFTSIGGYAQNLGVNATGAPPNTNAGLDIDFSNKGVLIPRVALTGTANAAPLAAHVAGMIVYNTATTGDVNPGFYYNNGTNWVANIPAGVTTGDMLYWNGTAWVRIPAGTTGQFLQFSSSSIPTWAGSAFATLTTNAITLITATTATTGGNITADGGSPIYARGVCYATSASPTLANTVLTGGTGTGIFTSNLTGLTRATTYYVRAYATNSSVTTYGNQQVFTTLPQAPTVAATTAATAVTSTTATSGGNVTNDGGATISERGICYGTTTNPTTANSKVIDGSPGTGTFVSNITGLTSNLLYYVRAYAINSVGTTYGTQISFTSLPTVTTTAITNVTPTTSTSGGNVTSTGTVTARGVCWSTTTGPTVALTTKTNDGTTSGVFTSSITSLTAGTLYYVRAYATNATGTSYGAELTFTTSFIVTSAVCTVTTTGAVSGGTISTATGLNITERGVVYGTSPGPTTANTKLTDPAGGIGTYVSTLTGLTNGVTYYIRAYCINNGTTVYANNELNFKTGNPYAVGDALAGGIIVYVDCSGQHGLIAATVDQSISAQWGCYGTVTGATGSAIYTGLANTNTIIAAGCAPAGTAAQVCAAYTAGGTGLTGITNWYLPSKDEFQYLWNQKALISLSIGCATYGCYYWTSTEYNSAIAYCIPSNLVSPSYTLY